MKRILSYLSKSKLDCILAPMFKLLEAILDLFVPIIVSLIIDVGINGNNIDYARNMMITLFIMGAVGFGCTVIAQYFSARAATNMSARMRYDIFAHVQNFSVTDREHIGQSALMTRMTTDVNNVEAAVNMVLRRLMRSPVIVVGAVIMAFTIDVKLALIFVVLVPALFLVIYIIMRATQPLFKKVQSGIDRILMALRENLIGVRVIRAFNRQDSETEKFEDYNEELSKSQRRATRVSSMINPLTYIIVNIAVIVLVAFGGMQVNIGGVSSGNVVALYNYMSQILLELLNTANLIIMVSKAGASYKRIEEVMQQEPSIKDEDGKSLITDINVEQDTAIEFKNVSFRYGESEGYAIEGISFSVRKGEIVGIIGGTGSGKSTVVNMISRLLDATDGEVCVFGDNVKDISVNSLRNKVGIVMQKASAFKGTIRDNVAMGKINADDDEIWEALKVAQAEEFVMKKADKLDSYVEQGGVNLSGGQKQRLSIARAVVKKPEILILDDSSSALDFATDAKLRASIRNMSYKPTVIIVSQRAASITDADKIVVLDLGKVCGIGTHDELKKNNEVYREILKSQFREEELDI